MGGDDEGGLTVCLCVCEGSQVESQFSGINRWALSSLFGNLRANPNVNIVTTQLLCLGPKMLHLYTQSPSLRVAVCEVLGEVLVRVLSGDKLDDSARGDRDRFLDTLQEHIHDAHSHARARVLQVYTRIVNSKVCIYVF